MLRTTIHNISFVIRDEVGTDLNIHQGTILTAVLPFASQAVSFRSDMLDIINPFTVLHDDIVKRQPQDLIRGVTEQVLKCGVCF